MSEYKPRRGREQFRDLIRRRRRELGLTQEEVAAQTEMSQRWVSNLETGGVGMPRQDTMRKLAQVLQLPIEELYLAAGIAETPAGAREIADAFDHPDELPSRDVTADLPDERDNSPLTAAELEELKDAMFHGFDELEPADLREVIAVMRRRRAREGRTG